MKNTYPASALLILSQDFQASNREILDHDDLNNSFESLEKSLIHIIAAVDLIKKDYKTNIQTCSSEITEEGKCMQIVFKQMVEHAFIKSPKNLLHS